jgi:hypothetical protein
MQDFWKILRTMRFASDGEPDRLPTEKTLAPQKQSYLTD